MSLSRFLATSKGRVGRLRLGATGRVIWHINADEPRVLDYNEEYK